MNPFENTFFQEYLNNQQMNIEQHHNNSNNNNFYNNDEAHHCCNCNNDFICKKNKYGKCECYDEIGIKTGLIYFCKNCSDKINSKEYVDDSADYTLA